MISAGNISGAIESLGGDKMDNIIEIVGKRKVADIKMAEMKIMTYAARNLHGDDKLVENWGKHLEKWQKEYEDLKQKYRELLSEECVVCADSMKDPILTPCCQTIMCGKCILDWVTKKGSCIMCRRNIQAHDLKLITKDLDGNDLVSNEVDMIDMSVIEDKPKELVKLVKKIKEKNNDSKIILFSEYDASYEVIYGFLKDTKLKIKDIQGTAAKRTKIINDFKNGKLDMVFLNAAFNGSGINLIECTDIIIYHSTSAASTEQIIGRGMRIGRKDDLHLHEFTEI